MIHTIHTVCNRCKRLIEVDAPAGVNVCGSCADELRAEEDALIAEQQAIDEDMAFEMNRQAYEEERDAGRESEYRYL